MRNYLIDKKYRYYRDNGLTIFGEVSLYYREYINVFFRIDIGRIYRLSREEFIKNRNNNLELFRKLNL